MSNKCFHVIHSTLHSLEQYEFNWTGRTLQVGDTIEITNVKTGKPKRIKIEYIRKTKAGYVIKNVNVTLILKKK